MCEILRRLNTLADELREIKESLMKAQAGFQFFEDGLKAYGERSLKEIHGSQSQAVLNQFVERFRNDAELRYPHRKILDVLLRQYDFTKREFGSIHFSRLVKEAHVGKNKAKGYLSFLEQKGYVERRETGYRTFFRLNGCGKAKSI